MFIYVRPKILPVNDIFLRKLLEDMVPPPKKGRSKKEKQETLERGAVVRTAEEHFPLG